jgi:ABC-type sugar transport system ATPase subunit
MALLGQNGAGKSTTGENPQRRTDSGPGTIHVVDLNCLKHFSPVDARDWIAIIYQELSLCHI